MIYDKISSCDYYLGANEKFAKAFEFIKRAVAENLPTGKYEIDGDEVYASVMEYTTKPSSEGKFEGHKRYIDVQYVVSGVEAIEVVDITKAEVVTEYDDSCDAAFFGTSCEPCACALTAGDFCVFYPHDLHKPATELGGTPADVKKIVVKVKA